MLIATFIESPLIIIYLANVDLMNENSQLMIFFFNCTYSIRVCSNDSRIYKFSNDFPRCMSYQLIS